jgi:UDP-3-O-[3-hydroxymyristoyl] glucosamine N-acyltransferase LpxD
MKLFELAKITNAQIENAGLTDTEIIGAAGLDDAKAGHVTFLSNPRYTPRIQTTRATAIYLAESVNAPAHLIVLRARDPYLAYTRALRLFHPEPKHEAFVHASAIIDETARVGANVYIGACVVIGKNVSIDDDVQIYPNVTIYDDAQIGAGTIIHSGVSIREATEIGARCVIYNNVVVGCDGFGYAKDEEKRWLKIPQVGCVVIEDDVEIGAGTTIDRASVGETRIKRGAKIDNLVQIGHSWLVGVVSIDAGLALPDFRAAERTFQLITQVAGRAGRGHLGGKVLIQTFHPEHYALDHACAQDYEAFYEQEIRHRKNLNYPPFVSLASLLVHDENFTRAQATVQELKRALDAANTKRLCRILGPAPAPLARLRGEHRLQILIKARNRSALREMLTIALADAEAKCDLQSVNVEIDPVNLM